MKKSLFAAIAALFVFGCHNSNNSAPQLTQSSRNVGLENVTSFPDQVTGITISDEGRTFVSFPRWRDGIPFSVAEVTADGKAHAYPNATWNQWNGQPQNNQFTCVQSVVARGNSLYVLDPSNPEMKGVVGKATLYEFDLPTNTLKNKWEFDGSAAPPTSYLNDLRIDENAGKIYISDSGLGAIVVLDITSGQAQRFLENSPTTKSESVVLRPDGHPLVKPDGQPQHLNVDGIALENGFLYYHALTGYHLYRIPASAFAMSANDASIESQVQDLGITPAPDGMIFDKNGNLYMADLEKNSIVYRTPAGEIRTLVHDPTLQWPDTFTIDPNNNLVFTDSHLNQDPPGTPLNGTSFNIYRIPLPTTNR